MPYSANQTSFSYKVSGNTFIEIPHLMEVPEFGGAPEKIDVTTLGDSVKKYIPGIKDYGDLVFKFLYDNSDVTSNFRVLKRLEDAGATAAFQIRYPDQTAHRFDAIPSVKMDAGAINGALTFSVTMLLQSDIAVINPGQSDDEDDD